MEKNNKIKSSFRYQWCFFFCLRIHGQFNWILVHKMKYEMGKNIKTKIILDKYQLHKLNQRLTEKEKERKSKSEKQFKLTAIVWRVKLVWQPLEPQNMIHNRMDYSFVLIVELQKQMSDKLNYLFFFSVMRERVHKVYAILTILCDRVSFIITFTMDIINS